ncbi:MAG: hypothetical protein MUC87_00795 [Bacteroidia bacterium]|jgi:hypothetical protein|nr:hypothetical protein [Bacteroidia bacterium]
MHILGIVITGEGLPMWMYFLMRLLEASLIIGVTVWWLNNIAMALSKVHPQVRSGQPGQVWLTLIPLFGLVWGFVINTQTSESLAREYRRRGWDSDEARPGFEIGTMTVVVACLYQFQLYFTIAIPFVSFVGAILLGGAMYRHSERLNAFRERLDEAPDAVPNIQAPASPPVWPQQPQQQWPNQPQWPGEPQQTQWPAPPPPQTNWPPPPGYEQGSAPPPNYAPPPPPDDFSRWMPPDKK